MRQNGSGRAAHPTVSAGAEGQLSVLIVEDEALIALNLAAIAEDLGLAVVGLAARADTAFALAAQQPPALAIVDINLTDGQTGPQIAAHLVRTHGTRIVFATGNPDGLVPGETVVAVLRKPYTDEAIAAALHRAIDAVRASLQPADASLIPSTPETAHGGL